MLPAQVTFINLSHEEQEVKRKREFRQMQLLHVTLRQNSDPFVFTETRFIELFRLKKYMVQFLIITLKPHMKISTKEDAISPELRIFATLIFYGTGTYQRVVGQSYLACMSQTSISRSVHEVTNLIDLLLAEEFVKFPKNRNQRQQISDEFERIAGFPGIIGAIDCTFVSMIKSRTEEHNYVNRHQKHAKNVQIVSFL